MKTIIVQINGVDWYSHVAKTYEELNAGLKYTMHLPAYCGILYVMPTQQSHTILLDKLFVPIDIVFIDDTLKVASVFNNVEAMFTNLNDELIRSYTGVAKYILVVNAGEADHVKENDNVNIMQTNRFLVVQDYTDPSSIVVARLVEPTASDNVGALVKTMGGASAAMTAVAMMNTMSKGIMR